MESTRHKIFILLTRLAAVEIGEATGRRGVAEPARLSFFGEYLPSPQLVRIRILF